jgi:tRNA G10  N-methylase Trm11
MNDLRAICARLLGNDLVSAECFNLTGGRPDAEGVAVCQRIDLLHHAAYLSSGLRCLAQAASLDELARQVQALHLAPERFRVEFVDLTARSEVSKQRAILAISNVLEANPDLDHPQHRFVCVVQRDCIWLGELLVENERIYQQHNAKPFRTSSSLPCRLARALVNLVTPPACTILDPFCGTASILLEAQSIGLTAYGVDRNPKMVGMSRRNLAFFGYPAQVELGDALNCTRLVDALVTDLPYGRLLEADLSEIQSSLTHLVELAPQAVYLAAADISINLMQAGYTSVEHLRVRKHHTMSRFVHLCHV